MNKRMGIFGFVSLASATLIAQQAIAATSRVSVTSEGLELTSLSSAPSISGNGRYITFTTGATELDGTSGMRQIYRHDTVSGKTEMISAGAYQESGNGDSLFEATMNYDGNLVAFMSYATNIGDGAATDMGQLYIRDTDYGKTIMVSTNSDGQPGNKKSEMPRLSADGNVIAFYSLASNLVAQDTNELSDIFVKDLNTGETRIVSRGEYGEGNGTNLDVAISGNGNVVAFVSHSSNLVADDTNEKPDAFVYYRDSGRVERISISSSGEQGNNDTLRVAISANGRYVAFLSDASNLVQGDIEEKRDVFIRDLKLGTTVRASEHEDGSGFLGMVTGMDISADGRYVTLDSNAYDEFQVRSSQSAVFVKDMVVGDIRQIDIGQDNTALGLSNNSVISHDGEYVAYMSFITNLVDGDSNGMGDIFLTQVVRNSDTSANSTSTVEPQVITVTETVYVPVTEVVYEPVYQTVEVEKVVEVCTSETADYADDDGASENESEQSVNNGNHWGLHWYKDDGSHDETHSGEHPVFDNDKNRVAATGNGKN